jgi:tripartite-type tricarboxylate transporter receptor subunit TctC
MGPAVLVVNPSFPARTVKELVELAKAKPGAYSYASAGFGTTHHLAAEMFKVAAGIDLTGVTYRGAAPANQDLIAGHVPIAFDNLGLAVNNIRNGGVRPLAITAKERSPLLPDVPTMAEVGYPNVVAQSWFALFVPAKTPRNAIDWLNRQANEVFADPALREQFQQQGLNLTLGSPEALGQHVVEETQRWGDVIRKAGITLPN